MTNAKGGHSSGAETVHLLVIILVLARVSPLVVTVIFLLLAVSEQNFVFSKRRIVIKKVPDAPKPFWPAPLVIPPL